MGNALFWGINNVEFTNDDTGPFLDNQNPSSGQTDVSYTSSVYLEIKDALSDVDEAETVIYITAGGSETEIYDFSSEFQNSYSGTVTEQLLDNRKYYEVTITPPDGEWPGETEVTVRVVCQDSEGNASNLSYSFTIGEVPVPDHLIKYNIYYRPIYRPEWQLSNPSPLSHDLAGNEWTIGSLETGTTYVVCIVAGTVENNQFIPMMKQALTPNTQGAGDLNIAENFPCYIIKTLRST